MGHFFQTIIQLLNEVDHGLNPASLYCAIPAILAKLLNFFKPQHPSLEISVVC